MECNLLSIFVLLQKLCSWLVEEIGVFEVVLLFVGELIQVCQEQGVWQGVIECVLFGFVQLLLVEDKYYNEVNVWVNCIQFGMWFIYYWVCCNDDVIVCEFFVCLLLYKLEFCDSVFELWLCCELGKCYDYECVDVKQLCDVDCGIFCEGQVKYLGDWFEKDDCNVISDCWCWLFGFSNSDKLVLFCKEVQVLVQCIVECDEDIVWLCSQCDCDNDCCLVCNQLVNFVWEEVDVVMVFQCLDDIVFLLCELKEGNVDLVCLVQQIDQVCVDIVQVCCIYEDICVEFIQFFCECDKFDVQCQCSCVLVLLVFGVMQEVGLQQCLDLLGGFSLEIFEVYMCEISKGINESLVVLQYEVYCVEI